MLPKTYVADEHDIAHSLIDPDALNILNRLRQAGYEAYLVGGSVRDLLVKKKPKDFDISTSARPEEIKKLFQRQCLLIGRRFRLAHIRFGNKVIEVATFRAGDTTDGELIVHDNVWGNAENDVMRRDFTINGLFYDPFEHTVIDYVGGWEDIHAGILRTIGDAEVRFKQDPVRMLRLIKFKARFDFKVDPVTEHALRSCRDEIVKSSPARILEEFFRMLESGAAAPFFQLMTEYRLLDLVFPSLADYLRKPEGEKILDLLRSADRLNLHKGKNVLDRAVLTACLLYPVMENTIEKEFLNENKTAHISDIIMIAHTTMKDIITNTFSHFPRRINTAAVFILWTQYRLTPLYGKRQHRIKLVTNKEFPIALKFLKLRALTDELLVDAYISWRDSYRQHTGKHDRRGEHHYRAPRRQYNPTT